MAFPIGRLAEPPLPAVVTGMSEQTPLRVNRRRLVVVVGVRLTLRKDPSSERLSADRFKDQTNRRLACSQDLREVDSTGVMDKPSI